MLKQVQDFFAELARIEGLTKKPFLPLSMVSGMPPTLVVTTGKPVASASSTAKG